MKRLFRRILSKKKIAHFFKRFANFWAIFFCLLSAEMKILLCNVGMAMGNKLYELFFFCVKKLELIKQILLFKKGFVIFLKGATFLDQTTSP